MSVYYYKVQQNLNSQEWKQKKTFIILRYYWDEEAAFRFVQMAHAVHLPRCAKQDHLKGTWGEEVKELSATVEYREQGLPVLSADGNTYQPLQC